MMSRNNMSPQNRRAMREDAEAAALAELEQQAAVRQQRSLLLRKQRLERERKEVATEKKASKKIAKAK